MDIKTNFIFADCKSTFSPNRMVCFDVELGGITKMDMFFNIMVLLNIMILSSSLSYTCTFKLLLSTMHQNLP